jgi:rhodanese-related sulfurtransferase
MPINYPRATLASHIRRSAMVVVAALAVGFAGCSAADAQDAVTLDFARAEHESGRAVLIDIREPFEHATGVAKNAQLLPMQQIGNRLAEIPKDPGKPVLLICNTQNRSGATLAALKKAGYTNVKFVQGGMSEWNRRGWPTVRP